MKLLIISNQILEDGILNETLAKEQIEELKVNTF